MRNVWLIVRRELAAYVCTPSGYVIAASILLINGLLFNARAVGDSPRLSSDVLQQFLIDAGGTTMLAAVLFSMRLLAEERSAKARSCSANTSRLFCFSSLSFS
jgi:ABC-2 type transport system permease protein